MNSPNPRLNKYLVGVGLAESRRKADELITAGRVSINGATETNLATRVMDTDLVSLDGQSGTKRKDIYIAYNKPRGLVCSHIKQGSSKTIFEELPIAFANLKIAGRLDKDSEGLMILSSDGDFINKITHPSSRKDKTYLVYTKQDITQPVVAKLNEGVKLVDGVSKLKTTIIGKNATRVIISEGRNRQIRRSFEGLGLTVIKLQRVRIGLYSNRHLAPKDFIFIKPEDVL